MGLLEKAKNLIRWLTNEDITKVAKEDLSSVVAAAMNSDVATGASAIKKTITDVAHLPTYIFWCKMEAFLRGTFHSYEDQINMANKFEPCSDGYAKFVSKQIMLIDKVESFEKVDYFANLTRAYLLECISTETLYFKLAKYLTQCTDEELQFIRDCSYEFIDENTVMISALYQYGLFEQGETINGKTRYRLSSFAKALKLNCLNFRKENSGIASIRDYCDMQPLNISETASIEEVKNYLGLDS